MYYVLFIIYYLLFIIYCLWFFRESIRRATYPEALIHQSYYTAATYITQHFAQRSPSADGGSTYQPIPCVFIINMSIISGRLSKSKCCSRVPFPGCCRIWHGHGLFRMCGLVGMWANERKPLTSSGGGRRRECVISIPLTQEKKNKQHSQGTPRRSSWPPSPPLPRLPGQEGARERGISISVLRN